MIRRISPTSGIPDRPAARLVCSMTDARNTPRRPLSVWLAGRLGIDAYGSLAERLAWEVSEPEGRGPTLLLYEPEPAITIGRLGSRTDVEIADEELRSRLLELRFVGRGGGAVPHGPGQVGVSLFAGLDDLGFTRHDVGGYVERFEAALEGVVRSLRCSAGRDSRMHGIFGRSGLLASVGIAVRRGVAWHGGFLNVQPDLELFRRVRSVPVADAPGMRRMGSIEADLRRKVRLQDARSTVVQQFVDAFAFSRSHVQSGVPAPYPQGASGHGRPERASRVG